MLLLRVIALAVIVLVIFVRIRLRDVPLERDEGEYAYTGQLILQGIPPFQLASNMKLPGTAAVYALILAAFGQTPGGVHLGFLIVNLATIILVFFLSRRLFGEAAGWVASASYALLSVGLRVLGTAAHATHFVVLPALGATLLLLRWNDSRRLATLFWSGLLYGLAVLMKQPGALFAIFGALYLLWSQRCELRSRRVEVLQRFGLFTLAGFLPVATMCLIFWHAGVFPKFWFWTVTYARGYGSVISPSGAVLSFLHKIRQRPIAVVLAAAGLALTMVLTWIGKRHRASSLWATAFLVFSFLAVCPGFYFRTHYFILMLPALALCSGAAMAVAEDCLPAGQEVVLFAVFVALSVISQRHFLFDMGDTELIRSQYGENPFPEAVVLADYIKNHAGRDAHVAVIGSEPEIYFYSQRRSATDYIYTYAMGEPQPFALQMQNDMIRDVEAANPEYIVSVNVPDSWMFLPGYCQIDGAYGPKYCDIFRVVDRISTTNTIYRFDYVTRSWLFQPSSPTRIFDWFADYVPKHYDIVGVADIISTTNTVYRWDDAAAAYQPQSPNFLRIFKRRCSACGSR